MFTGLSAFPLTPLSDGRVDEASFVSLISALAAAGVDSIGALGSTGSYAYLTREQRRDVTRLAISAAGGTPLMTSIGSVALDEVLRLADDAQQAGVSGALLAPLSYQPLSADEVWTLYQRVTEELSVPLCIYDNPATTGFTFSDDLLAALCGLKHIGAVKLSAMPAQADAARARIDALRARVPQGVAIGISGDPQSAAGLLAGCDVWFSVFGGLFPQQALRLALAARRGDEDETLRLNAALEPLWAFFRHHGSLRTIAAAAEIAGAVPSPCLPLPLHAVGGEQRAELQRALQQSALLP